MICRRVRNVLYPDQWLDPTPLERELMPPRASLDAPLPDDDGLDIPTFAFHPVRAASSPDDARMKASASPTPSPARRPLLSKHLIEDAALALAIAIFIIAVIRIGVGLDAAGVL